MEDSLSFFRVQKVCSQKAASHLDKEQAISWTISLHCHPEKWIDVTILVSKIAITFEANAAAVCKPAPLQRLWSPLAAPSTFPSHTRSFS